VIALTGKQPVTLPSDGPAAERIAAQQSLFPDTIADGKIDFGKRRVAFLEAVAAGPEQFTFSWAGRPDSKALQETQAAAATRVSKAEAIPRGLNRAGP
jgi:hypothetical protein